MPVDVDAAVRESSTVMPHQEVSDPMQDLQRYMRVHLRLREEGANMEQRDQQRLQHLADCQGLLYSIAELLQIHLPPRPSRSPTFSSPAPLLPWEGEGSPSVSSSSGEVSFEDWLHAVDIRHASTIHILGKAITKSAAAFRRAWSTCKHAHCFSAKVKALCLALTGCNLSDAQAEHATALLSPSPTERLSLQACVLSILQLLAGGCSSTLAATNVLVSPKDMLLKCAQHACHHNLNAEALWDMMYSTPAQGGTGLDGIVQVVMKCMPQLSCQDAIRASALLLLQNNSHGFQERSRAELASVLHTRMRRWQLFMQMEKAHFVREVDTWICAMREVAIPAWACLSWLKDAATCSDKPVRSHSTCRDALFLSDNLPSSKPASRLGTPTPDARKLLSASWSPRRIGIGDNSKREPDTQLAGSGLASQLQAFQSWLTQFSSAAQDTADSSCFEVFQRCLSIAPKLLTSSFYSLGGSAELPVAAITSVFERLCLQPPTANQAAQMKLFLDVQGDGKIRLDDLKHVLPALCFSAERLGLGNAAGLSGNGVLVKIALWCCYMNVAPSQLCSTVGTAGLGILTQRQVFALLKVVAKGFRDHYQLVELLAGNETLSPGGDGAISSEHLCTTVRRILRQWERAGVSPSRACWRP